MATSPPSSPPQHKKLKMSSTTTSDADDEEEIEHNDGAEDQPPPPSPHSSSAAGEPRRRFKRRKIAIFLCYCGAGYQGMQKNPGARTIEGDLEEALFLAGAVPEADRGVPRRFDWARAARTDKGVSAAGQVVSGRFYVDPPGLVDRINANLSSQIRIFGFRRVTASFNAKKFCDRRRYVYLLPVFALDPNAHPDRESVLASLGSVNELSKCLECSERGRKVAGLMGRQTKVFKEEEERTKLGNGGMTSLLDSSLVRVTGAFEENERIGFGGGLKSESMLESEVSVVEERIELGDGDSINRVSNVGATATTLEPETLIVPVVFIEEGKTEIGKGKSELGETNSESLLESSVSKEEKKAESGPEEFKTGDNSMTEMGVLKEKEKVEPSLVGCNNTEQMPAKTTEFCYGEKERQRFNGILNRYVGTHNFHNFTTRTKAEDPSARRYIVSFDANSVVNIEGIEFVKCEVVGQSFMLHQIRKMIGLAVAIMRNCTPESMMDTTLRKDININIPTAPEVGLYLDECLFTSYNQKWKDSHEAVSMEAYAEQAENFKMKHIYSHIAYMEQNEGAVALWLHSLNHRNYPDFGFVEANRVVNGEEIAQVAIMAE